MAQIKGTAMLQCVKLLRAQREKAAALLSPELRQYLEKRIAISVWYPEEDHLGLLRVVAELVGTGHRDVWEFLGRASARNDLQGIYRNMLRLGDPDGTLRRGPALWQAYHDSGAVSVEWEGENVVRVSLAEYGLRAAEMCGVFGGYYHELLHLSGAREVSVAHTACRLGGAQVCQWHTKWLSMLSAPA
ncbi:MAG TPA: DUF2378 family protein [Myxococcota bacterium]|nr:DUF2378 family protein [Myxococcota bacterium]